MLHGEAADGRRCRETAAVIRSARSDAGGSSARRDFAGAHLAIACGSRTRTVRRAAHRRRPALALWRCCRRGGLVAAAVPGGRTRQACATSSGSAGHGRPLCRRSRRARRSRSRSPMRSTWFTATRSCRVQRCYDERAADRVCEPPRRLAADLRPGKTPPARCSRSHRRLERRSVAAVDDGHTMRTPYAGPIRLCEARPTPGCSAALAARSRRSTASARARSRWRRRFRRDHPRQIRSRRACRARIEATRLGLDIRYFVTKIATGTTEWLYADPVAFAADEPAARR